MKKLLLVILFLTISSNLFASSKIVYIDINKILNDSKVGKKTINDLDKELKNENEKFKKIEQMLKKEENEIIAQKNVLSEEDYKKKLMALTNKINNYKKERSSNIPPCNDMEPFILSFSTLILFAFFNESFLETGT